MSQISKSVDFTKTQKSRYLDNEALFLLQLHTKGYFITKNSFVAEVISNLPVDETESLLKCPCDIYLISALVSEERVILFLKDSTLVVVSTSLLENILSILIFLEAQ